MCSTTLRIYPKGGKGQMPTFGPLGKLMENAEVPLSSNYQLQTVQTNSGFVPNLEMMLTAAHRPGKQLEVSRTSSRGP
jgi:hypothetical protein